MKTLRLIGVLLGLTLCIGTATAYAFPLRTWNHRFNAALLGTGPRRIIETGAFGAPGLQNSYFSYGQVFSPLLVIDFDDIYATVGDGALTLGAGLSAGAHTATHLFGIGVGAYADVETSFQAAIPSGLFALFSEGNTIGAQSAGSGAASLRAFAEYGVYVSVRPGPFTVAAKVGRYAPLAYTRDGKITYSFATEQDGRIDASAELSTRLFSAVDLANAPEAELAEALSGPEAGLKLDLGLVYNPERTRPVWGVSVGDIPLAAATPRYAWEFTASAAASSNGLLDAIGTEDKSDDAAGNGPFNVEEPDTQFLPIDSESVVKPLRIGGFVRFPVLRLIDVIPHAEMVFDEQSRLNGGVTIEGSSFPFSVLSLALAYRDVAWHAGMGLRLNLHLVEIGATFRVSSPELRSVLAARGASLNLVAALGW